MNKKSFMTLDDAKLKVATYLRAWCDTTDSDDVIEGFISAGVIKAEDVEVMKTAFIFFRDKLRKEELKYKKPRIK